MSKPLRTGGRRNASRPQKVSEKRAQLQSKTFRLPVDLVRRVEKRAMEEDKSLNQVVQEQLEVWAVGGAWERFLKATEQVVDSHKDPPQLDWKVDKDELHERDP